LVQQCQAAFETPGLAPNVTYTNQYYGGML
jgi:hypothetical protein